MNSRSIRVSMDELSPIITGLLAEGSDVVITVTGNSMAPLWHHLKSRVTLTSCDPKALKKGDVPLYRRADGKYVLHRIVKVHEDTYDLAGDAQWTIERGLEKERVIALCRGYVNDGGRYHSCDEPFYRFYTACWRMLLPMRKFIFKLYGATYGKLKKKHRNSSLGKKQG